MRLFKRINFFTVMNDKKNPTYDAILDSLCDKGIDKIISHGTFNSEVKFNDGTYFYFWDTNFPYAWLSSCKIKFPNDVEYEFENCRPSKKVMNKFYEIYTNADVLQAMKNFSS